MRKRALTGLVLFLLGFASSLWAQSGASIQYAYDALGRLTTVVDPSGNVATYNYDAVGNLLSITRSTSSPSALAIFGFSPSQGSVGQTVAIQGQNFSTTANANTVKFNGTTATVTAATTNQLTTTVPAGATTGTISVTVGTSTATSSSNFTVLSVPVVTSVTPAQVLNAPTAPFQVNGSNLTGATFSFVPAFTPAAISISNVNINGNGTSATMTLALLSNAAGSFTIVATNGTGSTSSVPSISNTLTVVSTDPFADSDGDGLSNIYEVAIGTNFAATSHTGDGLPDGWALFYTSAPPLSNALAGQAAPNGLTYLQSFQRGLNPLLPNRVPPAVANVFPADLATNYPTNGVIVVRFTETLLAGVDLQSAQNAINAALPTGSNFSTANASAAAQVLQSYLQRTCCGTTAVPGVVQVLQNSQPIAGSVSLSNDRLSITFAPTLNLSARTTYTVVVQNVREAGGNLMAQPPFQSSFTTGLAANKTTPGSVFTNPPNGATGVETNAPFRIMFSTPVDPATLTSQTFSITDQTTFLPVPGMIQVDPFGFTASFVPAQPYGAGRKMSVTLTSGAKDILGNSLTNSFFFFTGFGPDNQGFTLVGTSPSNGATGVPLNALVVLEFEEPVDEISALTGLQVQLAGAPISGAIALSDGNKRITFTPTLPLTANSTYLVVTTWRLTDFAGNQLSNPDSSTFTTGNANDTTPPIVLSVGPANGAIGVPTNTRIQVLFSKPIDPLTVTNSTLNIFAAQQVAASVTVSPDGMTATLTPSSPLIPGTTYTFGPISGITDLVGQSLQPGTICFICAAFTTGLGVTTTAPTVVMVSPPNGTTGVPVNARVEIVMSAPVGVASVGTNAITVLAGSTQVAGTIRLSSDETMLTFTPSSLLATNTAYAVNVSGLIDQAGNPAAAFPTSSFTTGASGAADTSLVSVVSFSPTNGTTGVPVNTSIVVTFNKNVDPRTINNTTVAISDGNASFAVLAGNYAVNGAVVTFTPVSPLPGSATIQVLVNGGILDFVGNGLNAGITSTFTTAAVADTTAPQVVAVTPNNGATGIGLNATVVLTFSKSLNPNTVNARTMGLLSNGTKLSNVSFSTSPDNRVVTMFLVGGSLPAPRTIAVLATSGVTDLSGNALVNFESTFTTTAFDTTQPNVISQRPMKGAQGVPLNSNVVLYVNEPMNASTISGALHITQNGVAVSGTTQVTDSGQVILFTPSVPFQNNAFVQVFLDSTALDVDGSSLANYQGSFNTAVDTSTTAPNVVNTNPTGGSGVPTNVVIDVGFDQALNASTVNTTTVSLLQGGSTVVPIAVSLVGGGTIIQITPSGFLAANTSYTVQLATGLQGVNGHALQFTGTYLSFTTGAGTDTVNPTVLLVSPPNGAGNVGDNANIRVRFSEAINQLTVSGSTIAISGGGVTQVPYSFSFNGTQEVLIAPYTPLPDATQMSVAISGVTDVRGNQVVSQTTQFTTGTGPDAVIPAVISSNPFSGETNVPLNTAVMLGMNEPIDPGAVNCNTVSVQDQTTLQQVAGCNSVSVDGMTITFLPSASLAASRNYQVLFVNRGITDLAGNSLITAGTGLPNFLFTTGTAPDTTQPQVNGVSPANLLTGVPINAQVVVQFNEPVDALTVNQVTLSGGSTVSVTKTLSNANKMLTLVPIMPLNTNTTYTVTVAGVQDIGGNSLAAAVTTTFTTGISADLTPPTVASTTPLNGATGVLTNTVIQVQFSKRIDRLTVTNTTPNATFQVYPTNGGPTQAIAGTIQVSSDGLTATFTPVASLATSTAYSISLTGILDLVGQPITPSLRSFTTGTQ